MTIECYYDNCPKHSTHFGGEGPFCDESKCIMDEWPDNCTCRGCAQKFTCKFAGDLYNTDLDCLMDMKEEI